MLLGTIMLLNFLSRAVPPRRLLKGLSDRATEVTYTGRRVTQGLYLSGNGLSILAYGDSSESLALASREPPARPRRRPPSRISDRERRAGASPHRGPHGRARARPASRRVPRSSRANHRGYTIRARPAARAPRVGKGRERRRLLPEWPIRPRDRGHLHGQAGDAGLLPLEERPLPPSVRRLPRVGLARAPRSSAAEAAVEDFGPRTARRSEPPRARSRAPRFEEGPAKLPSESPRVDDTSATRGPRAETRRKVMDAARH